MALILDGLAQDYLDLLAQKAFEFSRFGELSFDTRRTDFERIVAAGNHIFHIQNRTHLLRDKLAVGMSNSWEFIDIEAQHPICAATQQLDVNNLDAFACR